MAKKRKATTSTKKTDAGAKAAEVALVGEIKELIKDLELESGSNPESARGAGPIEAYPASPVPSTVMCPW
jgi:hypothetical protein